MSSNPKETRGSSQSLVCGCMQSTASQTGNDQKFPRSYQVKSCVPENFEPTRRYQRGRVRGIGNKSVNPSGLPRNIVQTSRPQISRPDDVPLSLNRGTICERQGIVPVKYFRTVRPESSKSGKQGTSGQPLRLLSNYFPITSHTNWTVYQYSVKFSPEEENIRVRRCLVSNHRELLGCYIYDDGAMLFSNTKYDSDEMDLTSQRSFDGQNVKISIKFVSVIEIGDHASIQLFNLLMRNCLRHLELKLTGGNYFDTKAKIQLRDLDLQLWPGYDTAIGKFDGGLLLRSEISSKVMRDETVLDFFKQCHQNRANNPDWLNLFKENVIGTTVLTRYNHKTYRIDDVRDEGITSTFTKKDGSKMSYIDYYKEKWQITLREPFQPLLVSIDRKFKFGNVKESDIVCLVPELCTMIGMTDITRQNRQLTTALSKNTSVSPKERITRYNDFMALLLSSPKSVETLSRWNIQLTNKLVEVPSRVLKPQTILSNGGTYSAGGNANWTNFVRSNPMYTSASVDHWIVIVPQMYMDKVRPFLSTLKQVSDEMSFMLPQPEVVPIQKSNTPSYLDALEKVVCTKNPSFILCVIPTNRQDLYKLIKRKLCVERAVLSQVVELNTIEKKSWSVYTALAIQINSKLGGVPWLVKIPKSGLLVIGIDVCHNPLDKSKSYVAMTASLNDTQSAYYCCVEQLQGAEEISKYFLTSITKILLAYKSKNDKLPTGIIVYRDGVGDDQLSYVLKTELRQTKMACKNFYDVEGKDVPLAFIIVNQRISTRFIVDQSYPHNPPPGTVIDSVVTDPTKYDFYLVSQNVSFGTVTPTHYTVIEDTLPNWTPDYMQQTTYKLSHMYFNCSGTIGVPAPCRLAHKLALYAAQVLKSTPNPSLNEHFYFL